METIENDGLVQTLGLPTGCKSKRLFMSILGDGPGIRAWVAEAKIRRILCSVERHMHLPLL